MKSVLLVLLLLSGVLNSHVNEQTALSLTIYSNQFALVKDTRSISFSRGNSDLSFTDVAAAI